MIYVIGSGPAGASAAVALVEKGLEVTLLDAGLELESERAEAVRRLGLLDRERWDEASVALLRENMSAHAGGVDLKYVYGSDYPYRGMDRYQPVELDGAKMVRSLAKGGLSSVWGGSILPFRGSDIKGWPIGIQDLEPHYRAVLSFMPHSGRKDGLESILPLYSDDYQRLRPCRQAASLLDDMLVNEDSLKAQGLFFGLSRLAVEAGSSPDRRGCVYCGLCLYGCPYGLIYSTTSTLQRLSNREEFHYRGDVLVEKLVESQGEVRILGKTLSDAEPLTFTGSHAYLACGPLSSTRILLQSLEAFDRPVRIRHSEHFQLPLLRYRGIRNVTREDLHTLAQIYVEILDETISEHTVHMQIYAYNDLYVSVIGNVLGPPARLVKKPLEALLGRLLIIKGYLHSDISSHILARLMPGEPGKLVLEVHPEASAKRTVRKVVSKLQKNRRHFKATPIPRVKIGAPGTGNHSGGSFPMRHRPSEFETDVLGRPCGFEKVHVVDSTVFPSVPATTISLTIMANAHRIASAHPPGPPNGHPRII